MLQDEINRKRKELNESIEKHEKYEDVYRLSVELDDLITEFYKNKNENKKENKIFVSTNKLKKILYFV